MSAASELYERITEIPGVDLVPYTVANVSPLRVTIAGGSVEMPAVDGIGQAFTLGHKGWCLYKSPIPPILLKAS